MRGRSMRAFVLLAAMMMAPVDAAFAAETDYTEYDVIVVAPRSPDVQPYFLSVPAAGRPKAVVHPELADSGKGRKTATSPSEFRQEKTLAKEKPLVQRLTDAEE